MSDPDPAALHDERRICRLIERRALWRDVCTGRFFDFVQRHEGAWKLLHRQPIDEKDRIEHLACIQTRIGCTVKRDMPQLRGPQLEALYRCGARWLAGGVLER